jgi:hypothetical protein
MPIRRWWPMLLVLACALPAAGASAQTATDMASPNSNAADASPVDDDALSPDEAFALGKALTFDPAALTATPVKPLRLPGYSVGKPLDVSRDDRPDGSSSFTVKKPLPVDIETKLGTDLTPSAPTTFQPGQPLPGSLNNRDSGAAWASIGVPNLASVDARVDPDGDQGKVGTTLQHGIPVGSRFKVTVQDTFSVTNTLGSRSTTSAGEPLPAALPPSPSAPSQVWGNESKVKFDVLATGTSLSAGVTSSNIDPVSHNTLSAEQKIYGPLHVTTSVSDLGEPTSSKTISAGFKLHW